MQSFTKPHWVHIADAFVSFLLAMRKMHAFAKLLDVGCDLYTEFVLIMYV